MFIWSEPIKEGARNPVRRKKSPNVLPTLKTSYFQPHLCKLVVEQHLFGQHGLVVEQMRLHVAPHVRKPPEFLTVGKEQVISQIFLISAWGRGNIQTNEFYKEKFFFSNTSYWGFVWWKYLLVSYNFFPDDTKTHQLYIKCICLKDGRVLNNIYIYIYWLEHTSKIHKNVLQTEMCNTRIKKIWEIHKPQILWDKMQAKARGHLAITHISKWKKEAQTWRCRSAKLIVTMREINLEWDVQHAHMGEMVRLLQ